MHNEEDPEIQTGVLWCGTLNAREKFTLNFENKKQLEVSELRDMTEAGHYNLVPAAIEYGLVNCYLRSWKMSY